MKLNNQNLVEEKHKYIRMLQTEQTPEMESYCRNKIEEIDLLLKEHIKRAVENDK